MIRIVSATRYSERKFWKKSPLGVSLKRLSHDKRLVPCVAFENRRGLPDIYNTCILDQDACDSLVFIHDDVWIDDFFFGDRVAEGLLAYDVIGIAGNRCRSKNQPAWLYVDEQFTLDNRANLSGAVAHGKAPFGQVFFFGTVPMDCELLDGVFLAARKSALTANKVLFDPAFDFHFYDLDFCRTARQRELRIGTWPIAITHQSAGAFGSKGWVLKYRAYIDKWGD